jgi:hypothetical protein
VSDRVNDRTALYLMPRQPVVTFKSGASDVNARWSDVVRGVTTSPNAFRDPARAHRAGTGNVLEIKALTVHRRAHPLCGTPEKPSA